MEYLLPAKGMDGMNSLSADPEPGVESLVIDLDGVPFTSLRELNSESLRRSVGHVVERTSHVMARYRSDTGTAGERID